MEPFWFLESRKALLEGWGKECRGVSVFFGFQLGQFFDLTAAVLH